MGFVLLVTDHNAYACLDLQGGWWQCESMQRMAHQQSLGRSSRRLVPVTMLALSALATAGCEYFGKGKAKEAPSSSARGSARTSVLTRPLPRPREAAARGPRQRPRGVTAPDSPKACRQCAVEGLLIVLTGASRRLPGRRDPFAER